MAMHFFELPANLQVRNAVSAAYKLLFATKRLIAGEPAPHFRATRLTSLTIVEYGSKTISLVDEQLPLGKVSAPIIDARREVGGFQILAALPVATSVGNVLCGASYRTDASIGELTLCNGDTMCLLPENSTQPPVELSSAAAVLGGLAGAVDTLRHEQAIGGVPVIGISTW